MFLLYYDAFIPTYKLQQELWHLSQSSNKVLSFCLAAWHMLNLASVVINHWLWALWTSFTGDDILVHQRFHLEEPQGL